MNPDPTVATPAAEFLGDVRALASRVGGFDSNPVDTRVLQGTVVVRDAAGMRRFLEEYQENRMAAGEWPVIRRAFQFASEGKARELVALDGEWGRVVSGEPFAEASLQVGRRQLGRLLPLRDWRVAQRYAAAVQSGAARGWHVVVYGLAMAAYSIPLRQGLAHYAEQTLAGFAGGMPPSAALTPTDCRTILLEITARIPALLKAELNPAWPPAASLEPADAPSPAAVDGAHRARG